MKTVKLRWSKYWLLSYESYISTVDRDAAMPPVWLHSGHNKIPR